MPNSSDINEVFGWFSINLHLAPFFISIILGMVLMSSACIVYQVRARKLILLYTPFSHWNNHNTVEKRMLLLGLVLFLIGFTGLFLVSSKFGYFYLSSHGPVWTK